MLHINFILKGGLKFNQLLKKGNLIILNLTLYLYSSYIYITSKEQFFMQQTILSCLYAFYFVSFFNRILNIVFSNAKYSLVLKKLSNIFFYKK
jgi:hypothetical protein